MPSSIWRAARPARSRSGSSRTGAARQLGQEDLARDACHGHFLTLASGIAGDEDALPIRSDARVLAVALKAGEAATYQFAGGASRLSGRVQGRLTVNDVSLEDGDGAAIRDETTLRITALDDVEALLADTLA